METVWFSCPNPLDFMDCLYFAKWLMLRKVPFSVEYDGFKVGYSGIGIEKEQMEYWKSA